MVVSLWSAPDDGLAWLQGPSAQCGAPCDLDEALHSLCSYYVLWLYLLWLYLIWVHLPWRAGSPLQTAARSAACGCSLGTYILAGDVQALAPRRHAHTAAAHAAALGPAAAAAALTTATVALAAALGASERLRLTGHPAAAAAAARARWRGGVDAAAATPHAAPATAAAGGPRWARRAGARQARDALTSRLQPSAPPGCSPVRPACNPVYQACSPSPPSLQPCASSPATPCTTPPRAASRRWPRSYP